jgi:hypothetical protein
MAEGKGNDRVVLWVCHSNLKDVNYRFSKRPRPPLEQEAIGPGYELGSLVKEASGLPSMGLNALH